MKKWIYSVSATAAVASFFGLHAEEASANTHTVNAGDSLWKIANKYNVSVSHIKQLNNITSEIIHPNQVLKVSASSESAEQGQSQAPSQGSSQGSGSTYTVKSGDTLSKIALSTGTPLSELKSLNSIQGHLIYPGQVLKTKGGATQGSSNNVSQPSTGSGSTATNGTYTVKAGDTLSHIASNHGMSLAKLMEINKISGHLIFVGQKLSVSGTVSGGSGNSGSSGSVNTGGGSSDQSSSSSTYTVRGGDTLGKIAIMYKMSLSQLKSINGLSSDLIRVGQVLKVSGDGSSSGGGSSTGGSSGPVQTVTPPSGTSASVSTLLSVAQSMMGVPYVWGGSSPSGFDCSGFINYVYNQAGYGISRTNAEGQHARSHYVSTPQLGDLVFFENTYKAGISHVGIYIGNNQFIHANDGGVQITSLNNSYWKSKFESFKRFYK
ncbi:LysM peptidoglycan-binding domain-containing protein [Jeotgalibacillus sp. HH7-29]|uniref:LysM peptidoglycan-binding domain-containing protein n=1 Tax=Jeotgalibacillus haloalkalitolerans TaxID=3104292 RepID=A0ABU5KJ76_9BACL|nr:LysM peptidoglycan-binding domain-containing protein [Jeotgalibacillus sp. HH7-29]MDZ5711291.1 LysM peptidoglycan-binding domain-containing protein [Jeotgalibacillus sp. HH7-29]